MSERTPAAVRGIRRWTAATVLAGTLAVGGISVHLATAHSSDSVVATPSVTASGSPSATSTSSSSTTSGGTSPTTGVGSSAAGSGHTTTRGS